jgi:hypothetical protein
VPLERRALVKGLLETARDVADLVQKSGNFGRAVNSVPGEADSGMPGRDLVGALVLTGLFVGCFAGTGPANRVEDFRHLALQLDSRPDQVRMAGKVQWHPGADSMGEALGNVSEQTQTRVRAKCEAQKTKTEGWCFAVVEGHPDTGVFLMTDEELAFFRWDEDAYIVTARVPYAQIERVRLDSWVGAKFVVIQKDGEPLLLYVLINRAFNSNSATESFYEELMERVRWGEPEPAPL